MLQSHNMSVSKEADVTAATPAADDWRWQAVAGRDWQADGQFVYAVTSTGVFCRPSCPSRRPRRDRVRFFQSAAEAAHAGFRACKRCAPTSTSPLFSADEAVRRAARHLEQHMDETVSLAALARISGLSPFHLQRRFKRSLGISPREYQAARRADQFRRELRAGRDVASATYESGYGSPSRVYEAAPTGRGMAPAVYRRGGAGMEVGFITVPVSLGWLLVAATRHGICAVKLGDAATALEKDFRREYPQAEIRANALVRPDWVRRVVDAVDGAQHDIRDAGLPLDIRGTAFQWRVWRALQTIAPGETRSYSEVAHSIGRPSAVRAVARACATNPVCLIIPCHRVVAKDGSLGGYRWGVSRKARLLKEEKKSK